MQPFSERAAAVVSASQIACQVLLSEDNRDLEFLPLLPVPMHLPACLSEEDFAARELRLVGVVGASGLRGWCAFEEPLEAPIVETISQAFAEYVLRMVTPQLDHIAQATAEMEARAAAQAEVVELELLFLLHDLRPHIASA